MTTDPFRDLRLPPQPLEPRAEFRAALRDRMTRALTDPDGGTPMAAPTVAAPTRLATITPYLCCANAREAIRWYGDAFGAEVVGEVYPMGPDRPDSVGHAELRIGSSTLNLSDEWPEGGVLSPSSRGGATTSFVLDVGVPADVDVVFSRAVELGAQPERPPADQPYGSRAGWLLDPFGHRWRISAALADRTDTSERPAVGEDGGVTQAQDLWDEVGYYVISRPDLDRAKAFYRGLFGWEFAPENETPSGRRAAHVTSSRVPFGLTDDTELGPIKPWFRVRDLEAAVARVRELGGEVVNVERYASGGAAVCRDDQGVEFDLHEPAPGY